MEQNHTKKNESKLSFAIDGKSFETNQQYLTGLDIRRIGNIPDSHDVYLTVPKPWKNELIENNVEINLARPEVEHFISLEREIKLTLIVNGKKKHWEKRTISFEEIVILAFVSYDPNPNKVYTVSYDMGPRHNPEGKMVVGDLVFVKNKMIFNVSATDKS